MRLVLIALVAMTAAVPVSASEGAKHLGIPDAFWLPLNLAIFIFVLYWFVGRPVGSFLDSRRENIGSELEDARKKLAEAEELRAQVIQRLEQVEGEMDQLKQRAEADGKAEAERIASSSKVEEERFLGRVEDEISRRHAETRTLLAKETAALTAQLAHDLLEREITDSDRDRILKRSLAAMESLGEGD